MEDLDFDESDNDELSEEKKMQEQCRRFDAQMTASTATWFKKASKLRKRDFQDERVELEQNLDGQILSMVVTMDDWEQLCVEMDRFKGAMEHVTEESYADNECRRGTLTPAATPKTKSTWSPQHAQCDR